MKSKFCILALILVLFLPNTGRAQSTTPDLMGTWISVTGEVAHWSGTLKHFGEQVGILKVEEQLGGVFRGHMVYQNEKSGPKFEGSDGIDHTLSEPVLGVIDWDGKSVVWVDKDDETVHRARLVNSRTMEVIAYEPGEHAVVNRMIMIRK
ncbi:MAG: hypothetical protein V7723_16810 [Sneathiella sp.]|uniref:hypothetical protein n=1 Tax=Sneathiella sp. TaxID=1964365 RepID=UPI0030023A64